MEMIVIVKFNRVGIVLINSILNDQIFASIVKITCHFQHIFKEFLKSRKPHFLQSLSINSKIKFFQIIIEATKNRALDFFQFFVTRIPTLPSAASSSSAPTCRASPATARAIEIYYKTY